MLADIVQSLSHSFLITLLLHPFFDLLADLGVFIVERNIGTSGFDQFMVVRRGSSDDGCVGVRELGECEGKETDGSGTRPNQNLGG